jgi:hypothetical protein
MVNVNIFVAMVYFTHFCCHGLTILVAKEFLFTPIVTILSYTFVTLCVE